MRLGCGNQLSLKEILFLFASGLVVGVTINFISQTDDIETSAMQVPKQNLSAAPPDLFHQVRILCLVLTTESNHKSKAIHVKNTWGRRCNKLIFASNVTDFELGALKLQTKAPDSFGLLWAKTKNAMKYAYENLYNDYDWFYKADDDSYAIMDNMRYLLSAYPTNESIYFGRKFKSDDKLGYFSGGSGYVISRAALKKFVTEALTDKNKCHQGDDGREDLLISRCMNNVGAYPGDARDKFQRETFFPSRPDVHLFSTSNSWYFKHLYYSNDEGLDCCSNYTISFHSLQPPMMYWLDYLVFNVRAYGVRHVYDPLPQAKNFTIVVQKLLAETNGKKIK